MSQENLIVAQRQLDAYNAQDLDTYVSYFAEDCVVSGLNGAPTETSRDASRPVTPRPSPPFRRTRPI